jgi:hypothetical protein
MAKIKSCDYRGFSICSTYLYIYCTYCGRFSRPADYFQRKEIVNFDQFSQLTTTHGCCSACLAVGRLASSNQAFLCLSIDDDEMRWNNEVTSFVIVYIRLHVWIVRALLAADYFQRKEIVNFDQSWVVHYVLIISARSESWSAWFFFPETPGPGFFFNPTCPFSTFYILSLIAGGVLVMHVNPALC